MLDDLKVAVFRIIGGCVKDTATVEVCKIPEKELQAQGDGWELKPDSEYVKLMAIAQSMPSVNCVTIQKNAAGSVDEHGKRTAKNHVLALIPGQS